MAKTMMRRTWLNRFLVLAIATAAFGCAASADAQEGQAPDPARRDQPAAAPDEPRLGLTIYSNADPAAFDPQQFIAQQRQGYNPMYATQVPGFGVVRDMRQLELDGGMNTIRVTDVAEFIDPTTVSLTDLDADGDDVQGIEVVGQEFQFDLVSPQKLLEKYVDQEITAFVGYDDDRETVTGTLLSAARGQLVLRTDQGVRIVPSANNVQLGELPGGLITRPTLIWQIWSPNAGRTPVRTAYQTDGITWRADYNLVLGAAETSADLGAWVTVLNLSGARYADAQLKLIAGDVQRIQPQQRLRGGRDYYDMARAEAAAPAGFEEKSFFEYHMYTLGRPATIEQNSTQQIALFPTKQGIDVEKVLVYYGLPEGFSRGFFPDPRVDRNFGTQSNKKVDVYIQFENEEEAGLGLPLPKGKVRVYKADQPANGAGEGTLEFIGEDLIDHTSKGETVRIKLGQAFDVTGERTQVNFRVDHDDDWMEETIEITLNNAKDEAQDVIIRENLYRWVNWEIQGATANWEKIDSRTIHFPVTVPAGGEKTVRYTARYTW